MSGPIHRTMTAAEWAMLLTLSVLWGGSFFFVGIAVKELPPLTIVVLRVGLAAAMLGLVLRLIGLRLPRERSAWIAFFGMGLLNNAIPFCRLSGARPTSRPASPQSSTPRRHCSPWSSHTF